MILVSQYLFDNISELELVDDMDEAGGLVEEYAKGVKGTGYGFSLVEFRDRVPVSVRYYAQGHGGRWAWTIGEKQITEDAEMKRWRKWRELNG